MDVGSDSLNGWVMFHRDIRHSLIQCLILILEERLAGNGVLSVNLMFFSSAKLQKYHWLVVWNFISPYIGNNHFN